jgi:hypothetical protein
MIINDHRFDNYIHDVALMVENFSRVFVSSMAKVVCLRNVSISKGRICICSRSTRRRYDG